ncbi:hypothetical protein FisN_4Lh581 [Fistulifera solaris]|uniref:HSF-type DNA-binding domain-containing protein n=1 Tax=Fistulifera solaris TaxID=1519565 RepID=A0A1Z5KED7_FISSO|nr:hypothetical protein FisN_4Lh581 [Fistulifera solaris]|eukprot:GAX24441.1 hypothetical protein FisN_4Lh581 [Fistulifera solaris]
MPHSRQPHEHQQLPNASFPSSGYRVDYCSTDGMMHANRHHSLPWMRAAPTSTHFHHPSLMIHQIRSSSSVEDHHYRHVPAMSTVLSHDSASSASSLAKRRHQVAASVIMLAKGSSESPDDRSRPLKKRKTLATPMPCHVSPVSSHADDRTQVTQYSREEDEDHGTIVPAASALVPHFPSVLHMLLTVSKDGVLEWSEHGKAWRIVRWEALRRSILPQFFPQLQSMDAFLAHISAWGFREVTEGADVGAYTHEKFCRDTPELCREMVLPSNEDTPVRQIMPKVLNSSPRSILRVPSLSVGGTDKGETGDSNHAAGGSPTTPEIEQDRVKTPPGLNDFSTNPWDHMEGRPVFVNYHPEGISGRSSSYMPPYSPISIQSGRGRRSFFVSNRGRAVNRATRLLPVTDRSQSDASTPPHPNAVSKEE